MYAYEVVRVTALAARISDKDLRARNRFETIARALADDPPG